MSYAFCLVIERFFTTRKNVALWNRRSFDSVAFQEFFVDCAKLLRAAHGHARHCVNLSALRYDENRAFEAFLTSKSRGFDVGNLVAGAPNAHLGLKTVSRLTAIYREYWEKIWWRVDHPV
jgi:hypothetical protein